MDRLYNKIKAEVVSFLYKNYQVDIEPSLIYIYGLVVKLVYTFDLRSNAGNGMRVRVSPGPRKTSNTLAQSVEQWSSGAEEVYAFCF